MGSRINFIFKQEENAPLVYLYAHWRGWLGREILADALAHARPRWDDPAYGTRMMISHITRDSTMGETGYGIYAVDADHIVGEEHGCILVSFVDSTVHVACDNEPEEHFGFEDFVEKYHGKA